MSAQIEPAAGDPVGGGTTRRKRGAVSESRRRATSTSEFGVGRRESHDASDFYARFVAPELSADETVERQPVADEIWCQDAREMGRLVRDGSVALVVTSPPYFAGKAYEVELGEGHIPGSYQEYLRMLHDVFAACVDKLEAGGRIAVNVANLGRKPYRSLSSDVIRILSDDLGLLLRGEIIWRKHEGTSGNCAWGSFQSASNPVLRDLTERVIVASKGRFERALPERRRVERGLPHTDTITKDDFMRWTTDVWDIAPESASRVGHPAPFPVELPQRLIELYTYEGDVVLDPFMGSGSTAVAAIAAGRRYLGFDTDPDYVHRAKARAAEALAQRAAAVRPTTVGGVAGAITAGRTVVEVARELLAAAGFTDVVGKAKLGTGVEVALSGTAPDGARWHFDVSGAVGRGSDAAGLRRSDVLWKTLGRAAVVHAGDQGDPPTRLVLLSTGLPTPASAGGKALRALTGADAPVLGAVDLLDPGAPEALRALVAGAASA